MALNNKPPYLLYNVYTKKEKEIYDQIVPILKKRLEEKFNTEFTIDNEYIINYDPTKATKDEVMAVNSQVFKYYYQNKNKG